MRKRDTFKMHYCREMSVSFPSVGDLLREVDLDAVTNEIMDFPSTERPLSVRKGWQGHSAGERQRMRDRVRRMIEAACGDVPQKSGSSWFVLPRWTFSLTGCGGSLSCRVGAVFANPSTGVSCILPRFDGAHRAGRARDPASEESWRSVLSYRVWLDTSWSMQEYCALLADALRLGMLAASLSVPSDLLHARSWQGHSFVRRKAQTVPSHFDSNSTDGGARGFGRAHRLLQEERVTDLEAWSDCDFEQRFAALRHMLG